MTSVFIADEMQCSPHKMRRINVSEEVTLRDFASVNNVEGYIANIGGGEEDFIMDSDWSNTVIPSDKIVIFVNVPQGGDSDVIGFIVAISIAIIAPQLAPFVSSSLGISAAAGLAVTTLGLQVAASALLPAPSPPKSQSIPEPSPQYSARVQTNIARLGEPVPIQFGHKVNALPDLVSPEYFEYIDDDQYVSMRYCLGMGGFQIHDLAFKNTPIDNIPDSEYEIIGPNETGSLLAASTFPAFDVPGGDLTTEWSASSISTPTGEESDRLGYDFGLLGGLVSIDNSGNLNEHSVTIELRYRLVNDTDTPIGDWQPLDIKTITAATVDPLRRTYYQNVERGRHEVQVRVQGEPSGDTKIRDSVTWAGLRGQNDDHIIHDDRTLINVRLRITEGSNNLVGDVLKNFTVDCTALNREYDGSTWNETVASRSMPWAFAKAYSSTHMGNRDISRLWVDDLKTLHDKLETLNHHFDYRFDQSISLLEGLQFIARYGRCVAIPFSGTFILVRDEPQEAITHVFQPDNCKDMTLEVENVQPFDHVVITYSDPVTGQPNEAVYAPEGSQKITPNPVSFLGCTSRAHALSEAEHFYWSNKETVTGSLETNNLKKPITFGSKVLTPQTRRVARQYGVIKKREGNVLTLSSPHNVTGSSSLAFDDGYHDVTILGIVGTPSEYSVEVEEIPSTLDIVDSYQSEQPTAYLLQDATVNMRVMRVKSVGGESNGWIEVSLVSDGILEPSIDPDEDDNNNPPSEGEDLTIRNLSVIQEADGAKYILRCAVDALPDAGSYICQVNDGAGTWRTVYAGAEPQWEFSHHPGTIQIRVAAIGSSQGHWFFKTINVGDESEINIPTPPGVSLTEPFTGASLKLQVDPVKGATYYLWQIFSNDGVPTFRREVKTLEPFFEYTYLNSQEDGGTGRDILVRVWALDIESNPSSDYAEITAKNPQMGAVLSHTLTPFLDLVMIEVSPDLTSDYKEILVYASQTIGFTPNSSTLVYSGPSTLASIPTNGNDHTYIRISSADVWGRDELVFTDEEEAVPRDIDEILNDSTITADNIERLLTVETDVDELSPLSTLLSQIPTLSALSGDADRLLIKDWLSDQFTRLQDAIEQVSLATIEGRFGEQIAREEVNRKVSLYTENAHTIIEQQIMAVLTDEASLSQILTTLTAQFENSISSIQQELTTIATSDLAQSQLITTLNSTIDDNYSNLTQQIVTIVNESSATSLALTALESEYDSNKSSVNNALTTLVSDVEATAASVENLQISLDADDPYLRSQFGLEDQALTELENKIEAKLSDEKIVTANIEQGKILTNRVEEAKTTIGETEATLRNELLQEVSARQTLSTQVTTIEGEVAGNKAYADEQLGILVNEDQVLAQSVTTLTANFNNNVASNNSQFTALANADLTLTQSVNTLTATVGDSNSGIFQTLNALSTESTALAQDVTELTAGLSDNEDEIATVKTIAEASADSVDGLNSRYAVSVDVGGYVGGMVINGVKRLDGTGPQIDMAFLADSFQFVTNIGDVPTPILATGTINGSPATGINGSLVVDGTISAEKVTTPEISALNANLGHITAGTLSGASQRFWQNLNATDNDWVIVQNDLSNNMMFGLNANGSAYFKGKLNVQELEASEGVFDTIHIKNHAISTKSGIRNRSAKPVNQFSWTDLVTYSFVPSAGDNNPTIFFGSVLKDGLHIDSEDGGETNSRLTMRLLVNNVEEFIFPPNPRYASTRAASYNLQLPLSGATTIKLQSKKVGNNPPGGTVPVCSESFITVEQLLR